MLNYIRAEIYKLLRRPYTYITLGILLALEGLFASMFVFHNSHSLPTLFGGAIIELVEMGTIGFCVCLLTGDIVFAGQYKNSTLKNEVSFGISRTQIYLGKLIAQTLLSIVYLVIMMGFFIGLCAIVLPHGADTVLTIRDVVFPAELTGDAGALTIVGYFLAVGLPLWIGAQAAVCMCQFLVAGEMAGSFLYVGIVFVLETIVELVGLLAGGGVGKLLLTIHPYFPRTMLDGAKAVVGDPVYLGQAWIVGAFWMVVCTAIGLYGFHRKEIK